MVIFNSYVKLPEGTLSDVINGGFLKWGPSRHHRLDDLGVDALRSQQALGAVLLGIPLQRSSVGHQKLGHQRTLCVWVNYNISLT